MIDFHSKQISLKAEQLLLLTIFDNSIVPNFCRLGIMSTVIYLGYHIQSNFLNDFDPSKQKLNNPNYTKLFLYIK